VRARLLSLVVLLAAWLAPLAAHAIDPDEIMANPALEARARSIASQLRCLVCQNESIDESQAPLAKDLRGIVRQRLLAGDTDAQIRSYLVARYGDFILLKPPFELQTLLLWFAPLLCLGAGGLAAWRASRTRASDTSAPLSEAERLRLAGLLGRENADEPAPGPS
jgi:cytochrome c-type biogenesis protein CcmH